LRVAESLNFNLVGFNSPHLRRMFFLCLDFCNTSTLASRSFI